MKALTIKQPYAGLIVDGVKDIENRAWKTHFRGRIYIHAGASNEHEQRYIPAIITEMQFEECNQLWLTHGIWDKSSIIGEAEIIDCVQDSKSIWALPGYWHWVLANPVKYHTPIYNVKGKQSFWEFSFDC